MERIKHLTPAQCILLAIRLAADSNIEHFRSLTLLRFDVFDTPLVFRILLSYLPESLEPETYTKYISEVDLRIYLGNDASDDLDVSSVDLMSVEQTKRNLKRVHLISLENDIIPLGNEKADLARFLVKRSHRIEKETGLLSLIPRLVRPFLEKSDHLREWYVSIVLPLQRWDYDFYPDDATKVTLEAFESLRGSKALHVLLARATRASREGRTSSGQVARDFRSIVGPWIYGSAGRKRRALEDTQGQILLQAIDARIEVLEQAASTKNHSGPEDDQESDWHNVFDYFVTEAQTNFAFAVEAIEDWNGPEDVDLGGYGKEYFNKKDDIVENLRQLYCKACFTSIYVAEQDTKETVEGAHAILCRLADLLDFEPPPDLATSIHLLPVIEQQDITGGQKPALDRHALLARNHPLTDPTLKSYALLQMLVYSAYQLDSLGGKISLSKIARLRFWSAEAEQLEQIRQILKDLIQDSSKSDEQWADHRKALLWLRDWALESPDEHRDVGWGAFGNVAQPVVEFEILRALCLASRFALATNIYLMSDQSQQSLTPKDVEAVVIGLVLEYYDNASNGNKTRGGIKKASEVLSYFQKHFRSSQVFRSCLALIAATHALSFYTLVLQRGSPFRPVNIRVAEDPVALLGKVLEQNKGSYTRLDDLLDIGRNLVKANTHALAAHDLRREPPPYNELVLIGVAEHRIIGMAIGAALEEDDFETAYSYVVNRLNILQLANEEAPGRATRDTAEDDVLWRAALSAGKYSSISTRLKNTSANSLRRLEQRMELLSHALMLAPESALSEILAAWRRCDEELSVAHRRESIDEQRWNDAADARELLVPGGFGGPAEPGLTVQPRRKEMGRGAAEEAPMGLIDVARGAAAAFGRSSGAFNVPDALGAKASMPATSSGRSSAEFAGDVGTNAERVRKRDMVANAVTGGLASGIGWMLGATPVSEEER